MKKRLALTSAATLLFLGLAMPAAQAAYQPPPTVVDDVRELVEANRGNDECVWVPKADGTYMKACAPAGYLVPQEFQSAWETLDDE